MTVNETRKAIAADAYARMFELLYASDAGAQKKRYLAALDSFAQLYGEDRDVRLFSVPGRSEVCGNHTDHNHGRVLAAAVDLDVIAVASVCGGDTVRIKSEGHEADIVRLDDLSVHKKEVGTSHGLVRGIANAFSKRGVKVGGFDAYTTSNVLKGSGISSSAAYEVLVGKMMSALFADDSIDAPTLAIIGQYAENEYFGKPCGLMDQTACAVGGFVAIDFADPGSPVIEPITFDLGAAGYRLVIVNTGGSHADLTADYAAIPCEMMEIAKLFGQKTLRGLTAEQIIARIPEIRKLDDLCGGDRAILRALHFIAEDERAGVQKENLRRGDVDAFLATELASGASSAFLLQNIYATKDAAEQGLTLALALTERLLKGKGAWRVHGGGFAGTIQAFVREEDCASYCAAMDAVFGSGAARKMRVRSVGACEMLKD